MSDDVTPEVCPTCWSDERRRFDAGCDCYRRHPWHDVTPEKELATHTPPPEGASCTGSTALSSDSGKDSSLDSSSVSPLQSVTSVTRSPLDSEVEGAMEVLSRGYVAYIHRHSCVATLHSRLTADARQHAEDAAEIERLRGELDCIAVLNSDDCPVLSKLMEIMRRNKGKRGKLAIPYKGDSDVLLGELEKVVRSLAENQAALADSVPRAKVDDAVQRFKIEASGFPNVRLHSATKRLLAALADLPGKEGAE